MDIQPPDTVPAALIGANFKTSTVCQFSPLPCTFV